MPEPTVHPPIHPGEILREEFLAPLEMDSAQLARDLNLPVHQVDAVLEERDSITAPLALRLARLFGTSERFWLNLQAHYDLEAAKGEIGDRLRDEVRPLKRAG